MIKILWVEDDQMCINIYKYIFEDYQLQIKETLKEALESIENQKYHIIFSDGRLGESAKQGGIEIVKKAVEKGIPVIAMSNEEDLNQKMFEDGAVEIMGKGDADQDTVKQLIETFALAD